MKRAFLFTLAAFIVPIILLSGCTPSIPPRQEFAQEIPPLKQDMSRVYFFYGNLYTSGKMDLNKYGTGGTIYINGSDAGLLNKEEYIALDLQPGNYEIYWQPNLAEFDLSKHKLKKTSINFSPGKTYYLAANMRDSRSMATWFGAIGVLAADCLYVDTIDEEPLGATSIRLVDYKVFKLPTKSDHQTALGFEPTPKKVF